MPINSHYPSGMVNPHKEHHNNGHQKDSISDQAVNTHKVNNPQLQANSSILSEGVEEQPEIEEGAEAEAEEGAEEQEAENPGNSSSASSSPSEHGSDAQLAEPRGTLIIHAWNIRSISNLTNKHAVSLHLERHQPDLLIVTETWLKQRLPPLHQHYSQL